MNSGYVRAGTVPGGLPVGVEGVGLAAASASRRTMKAVRSKVLSGGECWDPRPWARGGD